MVSTNWVERQSSPNLVSELESTCQIPKPLAKVLAARGIDSAQKAIEFLNPSLKNLPDPSGFAGIGPSVERLVRAIKTGETIGIFGDYDVDGVTSTALLSEFFAELSVSSIAYIPNRLKEGYGLSKQGVTSLRSAGATIIVTVDCGITAHEEIDFAVAQGLDVIVVDHHTVPVTLPKAIGIINPHRSDCSRGAEHMCAVGVVFNLCIALRRSLRESNYFVAKKEPNLSAMLDLVALGTVADVVPLVLDNRIFVKFGLGLIGNSMRTGMRALLEVARVDLKKVNAGTLGFHLGPRINAAGRLEDAKKALDLLRCNDPATAREIAEELEAQNRSRRSIEQKILAEAISEIENSSEHKKARILVVGNDDWHPGVAGIVASRLVERFHKPSIVIGANGKGSGRSIEGFHLHEALVSVKDAVDSFGGHAHAIGLTVSGIRLANFRDRLVEYAEKAISDDRLVRRIYHDGDTELDKIDESSIAALARAEPFGRANPEPLFCFKNVQLSDIRILDGGHIKGTLAGKSPIACIAFGMADKREIFKRSADVLAVPEINEWQGRKSVQLRIRDARSA